MSNKETSKLIEFYAPEAIAKKIEDVARKELCSKSDVCRKAVVSYLDVQEAEITCDCDM